MNTRFALLLVCVSLSLASPSSAQITTYDFNGAPGNQASTAASGVAANLTSSAISRGSGVFSFLAFSANSINAYGWTTGSTPGANDYYTFTITPDSGFKVSFTNIQYNVQRDGDGPTTGVVRSSLDGFTSNIGSPFAITTTATAQTIDLSGAAYQNLTSPIEFRIYGYNASGFFGTFRLQYSSAGAPGVQVNGSVAVVPEAETYVFASLGIGLVGIGYIQHRRRCATAAA